MNKEQTPYKKRHDYLLEVLDWVRTILICMVGVSIFVHFFFRPVQVDGQSMQPTLLNNEIGFSNVFSRLTGTIHRFDVVVVREPVSGDLWVKRVIGLPGETVKYEAGKLYIDGAYIKEPFLNKAYMIKDSGSADAFTKDFNTDGKVDYNNDGKIEPLKSDEYFLVGDNRNNSYDSRSRGAFHEDEIVSKSVYIIYPFQKIGAVE